MHGYNNGVSMLHELCLSYDIILLQEHWLLQSDIYKLNNVNTNFTAFDISSMNAKASLGILTGRPFGGVACLWKKSIFNHIKLLDFNVENGKYMSFSIKAGSQNIVVTNVYFPCVAPGHDYVVDSSFIISHIETVFSQNPSANHILAGDFNFECKDNNIGYNLFKHLISDYSLICCDDMSPSNNLKYTYCHESLQHFSYIDHFFISNNLKSCINSYCIVDSGLNCSDHLPISCILQTNGFSSQNVNINNKSSVKQRWDLCDLDLYYYTSGNLLQAINVPHCLLHCNVGCNCQQHRAIINNYYNNIVCMLQQAGQACVPNIPDKCLKAFWNEDLNRLKQISIDMHQLWRQCGSPGKE